MRLIKSLIAQSLLVGLHAGRVVFLYSGRIFSILNPASHVFFFFHLKYLLENVHI